jgi:hypothetical protein
MVGADDAGIVQDKVEGAGGSNPRDPAKRAVYLWQWPEVQTVLWPGAELTSQAPGFQSGRVN